MTNLLHETKDALKAYGKQTSDVLWVGSRDGKLAVAWDAFLLIGDVEYDSGFGGQEIAKDLVVVGNGWWLERHEYDGSERWSYKTLPVMQPDSQAFLHVRRTNCSWRSLATLNAADPDEVDDE